MVLDYTSRFLISLLILTKKKINSFQMVSLSSHLKIIPICTKSNFWSLVSFSCCDGSPVCITDLLDRPEALHDEI